MTLETNNAKLWEWNADIRRRWDGEPFGFGTSVPLQPAGLKNGRRPDLVIFTGEKSENFLCVVEIKKSWALNPVDLGKLQNWFQWLDTCPYGMLCGFVKVPNDRYVKELKLEADHWGHEWVPGRITRPLAIAEKHQAFARILVNPNFRH
jgi:hypothetical protein